MNVRRGVASVAVGLALAAGAVTPAFATTVQAGGGTWSYGFTGNGTSVYSNYIHPSVFHRASTINYWGDYSCRDARAGSWAKDSQSADPTTGHTDNAYWSKSPCP